MKDLADVIAILQMIAKNIKINPDQQITMTLQKMTKEKLNQKGKKNLRTNLKIVRDILNVQEIEKVAGAAEKMIGVRFIPDQNISMVIAADEMIRYLMVK